MSKVVIIEDDPIIARVYETKLRSEGHQVTVAGDGESGIEAVKTINPNLVLVDLMLPDLSGVEVIRKLRRDIHFAQIPIIAYSGADDEVMKEAQEANATVVLSKRDMSPREIFESVQEVLEQTRNWRVFEPHPTEAEYKIAGEPEDVKKEFLGRILVVEDDPIISTLVKNIVEKAGYEAVILADGGEALRLLTKDTNFAAGIFDIEVPKIKGTDILRYMRTEKRLMRIPVMVMTADESVRVQMDTHDAGAALFLPKPFERAKFENLFALLVTQKQQTNPSA
jgi:DNA-binding response OmpR family regulator